MTDDFTTLGAVLTKLPVAAAKPGTVSRVRRRLIDSSASIIDHDPKSIVFQHTVFCQTSLPYRDPGEAVREWEQSQGNVALRVEAGKAHDPATGQWVKLGLPWGSKPRIILAHLNREALLRASPVIEIEDSLSAFVKRIRGFEAGGREIRAFKDQLGRLSAALIRLAAVGGSGGFQIDTKVLTAFDLWFPKDTRQRVLWPSAVQLSLDYFESLQNHAVPLDERAIAALAHSALGLDLYAWLAQRLHRIDPAKPQFVAWAALKAQFGGGYARMVDFKRSFRDALKDVHSQYRAARFELDEGGMTLANSPPPIKGRMAVLRKP